MLLIYILKEPYIVHVNKTQQINIPDTHWMKQIESRPFQTRIRSPFIAISPAYEITYKVHSRSFPYLQCVSI